MGMGKGNELGKLRLRVEMLPAFALTPAESTPPEPREMRTCRRASNSSFNIQQPTKYLYGFSTFFKVQL